MDRITEADHAGRALRAYHDGENLTDEQVAAFLHVAPVLVEFMRAAGPTWNMPLRELLVRQGDFRAFQDSRKNLRQRG